MLSLNLKNKILKPFNNKYCFHSYISSSFVKDFVSYSSAKKD